MDINVVFINPKLFSYLNLTFNFLPAKLSYSYCYFDFFGKNGNKDLLFDVRYHTIIVL